MSKVLVVPKDYQPKLDLMHTAIAINEVKGYFENELSKTLNLIEVSAPLLVVEGNGVNDNLNGVERIVSFQGKDLPEQQIEVVQSLAKWKRIALAKYGFTNGEGLYTNMKAIRRDELLDNLHSIYVDQWDWEKVISKSERNIDTLKSEVQKIYNALKSTEAYMHTFHHHLEPSLPNNIYFTTTYELENQYPSLSPKERETIVTREHGAVFLMQIGGTLLSGDRHDGRSPDYDDWMLNGDLLLWNPLLECAFEISSMGIRVDHISLLKQLRLTKNEGRKKLEYHKLILSEKLPYTIGGGIGQSRLCMFLLKKAHIGEVQASVWNEQTIQYCKENNIKLL